MSPTSAPAVLVAAPPGAVRDELTELLSLQGHRVLCAATMPELEQALAAQPAVALVALDHAEDSALALARQVRALAPGLPMLALAPVLDRPCRLRCLNAGLDDVCALPVDPLELRVRLRSLLSASAAARLERELLIQADRGTTRATLARSVGHELSNLAVRLQCLTADFEDAGLAVDPLRVLAAEVAANARRLSAVLREPAPEAEPLEVAAEVRQMLQKLVAVGPLREIELVIRAPDDEALVLAERAHLEQLVANLAAAALETLADLPRDQRAIAFEIEARADAVVLRAKGFRPWLVAVAARPRSSVRPLGLGLRAIQALVSACGGRCELEPDAQGRNTLAVLLPRAADDAPAPRKLAALA
jgi:DNA-binding response OmpR family regulator